MKKIISTLTAMFLMTSISIAQNENGYFGISFGPSIPMSDLASKNADNTAAGFANSGAIFDISFNYKLGDGDFGVAALLRGQANATDAQELANSFASLYPGILWTVESEPWSIGGLLFGGYATFPISNKVSFDAKAMLGFLSATKPELHVTASDQSSSVWLISNEASASSFAYCISSGFKFELGDKTYLLSNIDYLASNPEFLNVETLTSDGSITTDTWSQNMKAINFSIGIAYKL